VVAPPRAACLHHSRCFVPDTRRLPEHGQPFDLRRRQLERKSALYPGLARPRRRGSLPELIVTIEADGFAPDTAASPGRSRGARAILLGGLTAGALDILYACTIWWLRGATPIDVCKSVAMGLIGREAARAGGLGTALFGLLLHFAMTTLMAAIFYSAARRISWLTERAVASGILYGLVAYGVMNYVVIPLSAIGPVTHTPPAYVRITGVIVHMLFVGVPIALFTRHALRNGTSPA
jgi:hypothetical protein